MMAKKNKSRTQKPKNNAITLCLCGVCLPTVYEAGRRVHKEKPLQTEKDVCNLCQQRMGWSYVVSDPDRRKGAGL